MHNQTQVAYAATALPMGIARMVDFCGMDVPLWAESLTGVIFNLGGAYQPDAEGANKPTDSSSSDHSQ